MSINNNACDFCGREGLFACRYNPDVHNGVDYLCKACWKTIRDGSRECISFVMGQYIAPQCKHEYHLTSVLNADPVVALLGNSEDSRLIEVCHGCRLLLLLGTNWQHVKWLDEEETEVTASIPEQLQA